MSVLGAPFSVVKATKGQDRVAAPSVGWPPVWRWMGKDRLPWDTGLLCPSVWDVALPNKVGVEARTLGTLDILCFLL